MNSRNVKRRVELRPEVQDAVNDILNGKDVNSGIEWLQREYMKVMRREASVKVKNRR